MIRSAVPTPGWEWRTQPHPGRALIAASVLRAGSPLSFQEVVAAWADSAEFRTFWVRSLRRIPFEAYCWELPPLDTATLARPFECVFVENRELARLAPDRRPFAEHFAMTRKSEFAVFDNFGSDARLIAPLPLGESSAYTHLASFVRHAPASQVEGIWKALAEVLRQRLRHTRPLWLSTAGMGVPWLHLRLDNQPKYYRHTPYARADFWSGTP